MRTEPWSGASRWFRLRRNVLLPLPLGPDDDHDLALADREVDAAQHVMMAEMLVDALGLHHPGWRRQVASCDSAASSSPIAWLRPRVRSDAVTEREKCASRRCCTKPHSVVSTR